MCLAVAQVLLGFASQHHWLRLCRTRLGGMFPYLPHQPGYHKRLVAAGPLIAATMRRLAAQVPTGADPLRPVDATVLPCGASRQTARGSALAGIAGYGYCRSHSRWIWGLKVYLVTTLDGMPTTWCLATPNLGERDVTAELLDHAHDQHLLPPDTILVGDKGFAGRAFNAHLRDLGIRLMRPDRRDEPRRHANLAPVRQRIESIFDTLKGQLSLEQHGGRTPAGVWIRVAQRLLALAAAIWHNWQTNAPDKRSLIAYDH